MIRETLPTIFTGKTAYAFRADFVPSKTFLARTGSLRKRKAPYIRQPYDHKKMRMTQKKSVSFSNMASVLMRPISHEELNQRWIQPIEYKLIETKRRETIRAWSNVEGNVSRLDCEEHCLTGLEQILTPQQTLARKFTNLKCRRLLLEEQRLQKCNGFYDPERLKQLSQLFSRQTAHRAHLRAVLDQTMAT